MRVVTMTRYVAFLRGINVGGHVVKMDRLREVCEGAGLQNVKTFIASGNVLFESASKDTAALEKAIAAALRKALGYEVATFVRTAAEVAAIAAHPAYPPADLTQGSLLVGMLPDALTARDKKTVASFESPVDTLRVHKREVYWHARENFANAKFQPAKLEKALGRPATFRNITTIRKIAALVARAGLIIALLPLTSLAAAQTPSAPPQQLLNAPQLVSRRATMLREWASAVLRHRPGELDGSLLITSTWSNDDVKANFVDVQVLAMLVGNPALSKFLVQSAGTRTAVQLPKDELAAFKLLATELLMGRTAAAFVKRAALFHTDLAIRIPEKGDAFRTSLLVPERFVLQSDDGTQVGLHGGDVSWEFAMVLLDTLDDPAHDEDVRIWYRATLGYRLQIEELDTPHFKHGLDLLPDDAEVLFLNACLHEAFADPRVQAVVDAVRLPPRTSLNVQPVGRELARAEQLFKRAIDADEQHLEARIRYARTLGRLGQHREAAALLRESIAKIREPMLEFLALLFVGAEEEAVGAFDQAQVAYGRAAALYPRAQAPRIALSALAHRQGDRVRARSMLAPVLASRDTNIQDDPWWLYRVIPGRHANDLMARFYERVAGAVTK